MKRVLSFSLWLVFSLILSTVLHAQDDEDLFPFASYTLINTDEDELGLQDPIKLINAPFAGEDGVYCNGLFGNQFAGYVRTPYLDGLYDSLFAISLEFKPDGINTGRRTILSLGYASHYFDFEMVGDSAFQVVYNDDHVIAVNDIVPEDGQWYSLKVFHHANNGLNRIYLGDQLIAQFVADFIRPPGDGIIASYNTGNASAFRGYWRNLKIYGSERLTGIHNESSQKEAVNLYPNPASSNLNIDAKGINANSFAIHGVCGVKYLSGDIMTMQHGLDVQDLAPGVYVLQLYDESGMKLVSKKFVKSRP